ncbi:DUF4224 domain-containing protein [Burkholderia sp. B21-007]|uniref:DUF4224 domain-containing protein n=1 Tax=Burkholderia sp. B21-007 TaxID=2890407 RepID=UPI001E2A4195|nr:DUF4224 domain-containing protein [Burkholderia sp. B21-007]UEP28235.1 DUF4224 domain-containing protein [Burkholderia sp. B21-007]
MKITMQEYSRRGPQRDTGAYLGRQELRELTGTPQRARQILWLARQGWPHVVDVHGRVLVARAYHDKQMGIIIENKQVRAPQPTNLTSLNLGAV